MTLLIKLVHDCSMKPPDPEAGQYIHHPVGDVKKIWKKNGIDENK